MTLEVAERGKSTVTVHYLSSKDFPTTEKGQNGCCWPTGKARLQTHSTSGQRKKSRVSPAFRLRRLQTVVRKILPEFGTRGLACPF